MAQRRPAPSPVAVSPFLSDSSSGGLGARFSLTAATSLPRAGAANAGNSAYPATPFQHGRDVAASPYAMSSSYAGGSSPRGTDGMASPASPSGLQSPGASGFDRSSSGAAGGFSSGWGSAHHASSSSGSGAWGSLGGFGFGSQQPARTPQQQSKQQQPQQPQYSAQLRTPVASSAWSAGPPVSLTSLQPSQSSSTTTSRSSNVSSNTGYSSSTAASSSLTPRAPVSDLTKFSHPDLERIGAQLAHVAAHKTTSALLLALASVGLGVLLLGYVLLVPLLPRVQLWGGPLAVSISRDLLHSVGLLLALVLTLVGIRGLRRYAQLQLPLKELESLSERQRALMGWSTGTGGGSRTGREQRKILQQKEGSPIDAADDEQVQDRNALRARARVQQLTGANTPVASSSRLSPAMRKSTAASASAATSRSPIPIASLRSLGALGSSTSAGLDRRPELSSPFRTRGLAAAASAHRSGAGSIHDEVSLSSFAHDYEGARQQHGGGGKHSHTPSASASGSGSHSLNPFSTPSPRSQGSSFGGGFGGLFGGGGEHHASSALTTPPYATSVREMPSTVSHPFASPTPASALGGGPLGSFAAGGGGHTGGAGASGVNNTFSFVLPGHHFPLDDPRSDSDLHDSFSAQLRHPLRLSPATLDGWTRSMRVWLTSQVIRPFLRSLDASNAAMGQLAALALQQPGVAQAFREDELGLIRELALTFGQPSGGHSAVGTNQLTARTVEAISLLVQQFPARPEVAQRIPLEKYLAVESGNEPPAAVSSSGLFASAPLPASAAPVSSATRAYVAQRLQALTMPGDDALAKFQLGAAAGPSGSLAGASAMRPSPFAGLFGTRSGGALQPAAAAVSPSASSMPSDSALVLHALCCHLEASGACRDFRAMYVKDCRGNTLTHARMPAGVASGGHGRSPSTGGLSASSGETCSIAQVRCPPHAPYFIVTHALMSSTAGGGRREAVKYVTEPGRASLFQALALWAAELPKGSPLLRELQGAMQ